MSLSWVTLHYKYNVETTHALTQTQLSQTVTSQHIRREGEKRHTVERLEALVLRDKRFLESLTATGRAANLSNEPYLFLGESCLEGGDFVREFLGLGDLVFVMVGGEEGLGTDLLFEDSRGL